MIQAEEAFLKLKKHYFDKPTSLAVERKSRLKAMQRWIKAHESEIIAAVCEDLGKPEEEVLITEFFSVNKEIETALINLRDWMAPQKAGWIWYLFLSSGKTMVEPKGVSLILSPWNFPFLLAISPLVSAVSAGNYVLLKPSEFAPKTAKVVKRLCEEVFIAGEVICLTGDAALAATLTRLPFNHIFFTGSPQIGKLVMHSAAENLTSFTLELGGCNPAVIDQTANLKMAVKRILQGKNLNNGQSCVAPNTLYIHESVFDEALLLLKKQTHELANFERRVVNERHFERLEAIEVEAINHGDDLLVAPIKDKKKLIYTNALFLCGDNSPLIGEELFGPQLGVCKYSDLNTLLNNLRKKEKPLAAYLFTRSRKNRKLFEAKLSTGTMCINETTIQVAYPGLPFGGSNYSGIGKSKGYYGFREFSNEKAVTHQSRWFTPLMLLYQPVTGVKRLLIRLVGRL
ncbi:MAG: aldehyde dehydrogenase family protein [Flavobacteriales bacterium]